MNSNGPVTSDPASGAASHAATRASLVAAGLPMVTEAVVTEPTEAAAAASAMDADRFVVKAGGLLHKSDAGGVITGCDSPTAVEAAARELLERIGPQARPLVVQEQRAGLELLVGVRRAGTLGAVVVVGLGGIHAEVFRDVVRATVPLERTEAAAMLRRLRSWPLLEGVRGTAGRDLDAIVDILMSVSRLAVADPSIEELDLNPVMVGAAGEGAVIVDARTVRGTTGPTARTQPRDSRELDPLLRPRHIAVVGVSADSTKFGAKVFRYLRRHGFTGRLDAVHPAGGEVDGHPRHRELQELDAAPDLVISAVPARATPAVARQAVAIGARSLLVHSSDFAEIGPEGVALQDELLSIVREAGIPLAGPNSMGVVAPAQHLAASISAGLSDLELRPGSTAVLTSSGALGSCLATRLLDTGTGISYWVHAGNEADVTIAQYLSWLADDPATGSVGLLLEDLKDGPDLIAAGRRLVAAAKPVFAFTMARSEAGQQAALSHTGSLVGSVAVRDEVLRSAGIVLVDTLQELEDSLRFVAAQPLPRGDRLAALTFSGGACAIIADECDRRDLRLPALPDELAERIRELVPVFAAVRNPVDVSFQLVSAPDSFRRVVELLATSEAFDAVLVQFTTNADPAATEMAEAVLAVRDVVDRPIYVARYGGPQLASAGLDRYREAGVPVLDAPDRAVRAVAGVMTAARIIHPDGRWVADSDR